MSMTRSENMSRIKAKDTSPEKMLRSGLWSVGLRYRVQAKTPAGKPDIVFIRAKIAVFVDGCFWHGCPEHYVRPRSRNEFWDRKLATNFERDRKQTLKLEELGWRVFRYWEHTVYEDMDSIVQELIHAVRSNKVTNPLEWRVVKVEPMLKMGDYEKRFLVDLRNPKTKKIVEQKRSTKKWNRHCA